MGVPQPLPWPASAQVTQIRKHKFMQAMMLRDFGEVRITRWEDGTEHVQLRVYCTRDHCSNCDCDSDHVQVLDGDAVLTLRGLLNHFQGDEFYSDPA